MHSRTARLCALMITAGLPFPGTVGAGPGAAVETKAQAPKCQGERVTLVGRENRRLTGTSGRDVILTNGAGTVDAKGGPDLICVNRRTNHIVMAGAGADRVVVTGRTDGVFELGPGRDTFRGGPGRDVVYADSDLYLGYPDEGTEDQKDVIRTRGGGDEVYVGSPASPLQDVVATGSGDDLIHAASPRQAAGSEPLVGGVGSDRVVFGSTPDLLDGTWSVDNRGERLLENETVVARWSGLERFELGFRYASAEFFGGPADEEFFLDSAGTAHGGKGDDVIGVHLGSVDQANDLDGGKGHDVLTFRAGRQVEDDPLTADLPDDLLTTTGGVSLGIPGFEDFRTFHDRVVVVGDGGSNDIRVTGCVTDVEAGGGADTVVVKGTPHSDDAVTCKGPGAYSAELSGQGGDDFLKGHFRTDDLLDGGRGVDRANGGRGGEDVCEDVETAHNCSDGLSDGS